MKEAAAEIAALSLASVRALEEGGSIEICGEPITLEDILIDRTEHDGHVTETGDGVTISLNVQLSEELVAEGLAREMKNRIQTMRKSAGYNVTDRIRARASASEAVCATLKAYEDYLKRRRSPSSSSSGARTRPTTSARSGRSATSASGWGSPGCSGRSVALPIGVDRQGPGGEKWDIPRWEAWPSIPRPRHASGEGRSDVSRGKAHRVDEEPRRWHGHAAVRCPGGRIRAADPRPSPPPRMGLDRS